MITKQPLAVFGTNYLAVVDFVDDEVDDDADLIDVGISQKEGTNSRKVVMLMMLMMMNILLMMMTTTWYMPASL